MIESTRASVGLPPGASRPGARQPRGLAGSFGWLISQIQGRTGRMRDSGLAEVAEAGKSPENTDRAGKIMLVTEETIVYNRIKTDAWEVREAAKTKPSGLPTFYPALGGHCPPINPFSLTWVARKHGMSTRFLEHAARVVEPRNATRRVKEGKGRIVPA